MFTFAEPRIYWGAVHLLLMKNVYNYIKSDFKRYDTEANLKNILLLIFGFGDQGLRYLFWFRLSSKKNIFRLIAKYMRRIYSLKYSIQISPNTSVGYGLYLGHGVGIIISPSATIGNNCNLSQFTTIGSNHGKAATIGDNVYLGPSVCVVEDVIIGDNVTVGAGSVVVKHIPQDATAVGTPAKVISYDQPGRYVSNRWALS